MVLAMTRPQKHRKTGVYYFRQQTPADLRHKFGRAEVSWSLRTKDPAEAKARHAEAQAKQNKVWAALRAEPKGLALREIVALVGTYRRELDAIVEVEPGEPSVREQVLRLEGQAGESAQALEGWQGEDANRLLLEQGLAIDDYSRQRLLNEMQKAWLEWAEFQRRRSAGDFTPDPSLNRRGASFCCRAVRDGGGPMNTASKAVRLLETLTIPEGPKAGQSVKLAPFQKQFVKGALADASTWRCCQSAGAMPRLRCRLASPLAP